MAVPYEISHVYALVRRAGRFAVFPKALVEGVDPALLDRYGDVCRQLWAARETAAAVAVKWNTDSRHFDAEHQAMSSRLADSLAGGQARKGTIRDEAAFRDVALLFQSGLHEFAMSGGILLEFAQTPNAIHKLFAISGGPLTLSGANEAFRSALARARRWTTVEGRVALVFRHWEVEVIAAASTLEALFVAAHLECYRSY